MSSKPPLMVKALRVKQGKNPPFYITKFKFRDLKDRYKVDRVDVNEQTGYQRPLDPTRVRSVSKFLRERNGIFPNATTLNSRVKMDFTPENGDFGTLKISDVLWLIDGQHRIEGINDASMKDDSMLDFEIGCVILDGYTWEEELKEFYIHNTEQKSVPTDIAFKHLRHQELKRKEGEPIPPDIIIRLPEIIADYVVERLAKDDDSPWRDRIKLADVARKAPEHLVTSASMVNSLKPITGLERIRTTYMKSRESGIKLAAELVKRYWRATVKLCLKAYEQPKSYFLMKTTGVYIMHKLFPAIFDRCVAMDDFSEENMLELLKQTGLSDDMDWVRGVERGTGYAFYNTQVQKLEQKLPETELKL